MLVQEEVFFAAHLGHLKSPRLSVLNDLGVLRYIFPCSQIL